MTKKQVLELKEGDRVWAVTQRSIKNVAFEKSYRFGKELKASGISLEHTQVHPTKKDAIKSMINDHRSRVTAMTDEREELLKRIQKEEVEIEQLQQALKEVDTK